MLKIPSDFLDKTFIKLTNSSEIHYNFKYQTGLNIDVLDFNPTGSCSSGGLYFTDLTNMHYWLNHLYDIKYLRYVTLLDNEPIYVEDNKYKVKQFILSERIKIKEFIKSQNMIDIISEYPYELKYIKNQTDEICKIAVKQEGYTLVYVKNQIDEICKIAVKQYGRALEYVKNQTDEICQLAVKEDGLALEYVKNQTDEICQLAVMQDGRAICNKSN